MIRKYLVGSLMLAAVAVSGRPAHAQGFTPGYTDIGVVIGFGGLGDASNAFGGRFERGIKNLPSMGNGVLGIGVSADYYSWSSGAYKWSYIPVGVTANYHFKLDGNAKVDPFLGLGLGYEIINCDYPGIGVDLCTNSALYFIGRAGIRYFFKPNLALYADAGAGAAAIAVGVTFKLK